MKLISLKNKNEKQRGNLKVKHCLVFRVKSSRAEENYRKETLLRLLYIATFYYIITMITKCVQRTEVAVLLL